jgi:structural maintenance of chromosome 4
VGSGPCALFTSNHPDRNIQSHSQNESRRRRAEPRKQQQKTDIMSNVSPRKSTRAAASRRKAPIVDDSEEEEENQAPQVKQEEEDDFTAASEPPKPSRRGRPRKTIPDLPPPKPTARRRTRKAESIEPPTALSPAPTIAEPSSPVKAESPKKKPSATRTSRKPRASVAPVPVEEDSQLPTPQPSLSPEPENVQAPGIPLADITETAINEQTVIPESQPKMVDRVDTRETVLEKPMDILVRKRAAAMPAIPEPEGPKQRTVITNLVLTNFKSYAGRQVVGPFHASFSSVVGPNGSGKSNVIDALQFAFGFRASKMRQGAVKDLIHKSAGLMNLEFCEVEVHFQEVMDLPGGGHEVIPDSQLIISRKAFQSNTSKYYINNRNSDYKEVTTLLKGKGVDLQHKRFLILQGEVESIAQMKAKAANEHDDGLLEYLEDIIGTSTYKKPIEDAAAATELLNEECLEKSNRVQHVEREKSGLEDKKNKALAFIRDENELAVARATLYQIHISETDDYIQITQEKVGQLQAQMDEELQKHQGSEEEIKQLEKQYKKGGKEYERLENQTQDMIKEMQRIDKETVKFEEKKKFLAGKQKKLEKTKETSKFAISSADTLARQYADDVERLSAELADLEEEKKVEEKELESIRVSLAGKTQGLSDQIAEKQSSLEPWRVKINEKQSAIAVAQSELDILREKESSGARGIAEVEAKITGLEESKQTKAAELGECKAERKKAEKEAQNIQAQINHLEQNEPTLRTKLSGARQKADEARASLSATQTQGNVLTGLMRLKESGRIGGFHGRLGNLGAIDQKYDVAISTACPQLENIVVDSVEVGEQCIDYLRKNNLGRANFILLDRLAQRDLSEIDTPENVPRLFDLVKPKDERFRPAFFSVLQHTLVAQDLEQANRIAYGAKRWRVVTLAGDMIEKSGTMSGGGVRVAKGGMSSKLASDVTKDQVVKLEQDRDTLEQTFSDFQQEQRDLETALRVIKEQIPQLETKAQKIALELESFNRNIVDCERRIQELSAEKSTSKSDKGRIAALEKTIATSEKEVSKLHAETADIEAEIKALQDKIMEIGGVKLRTQKAKVDGLKQQIDTLGDQASNAEISKAKEEKQRLKHDKALADAEKELAKLEVDAQQVEDDMETHRRDAAGIKQRGEEAQEVCTRWTFDTMSLTCSKALDTRKEELQVLKKNLDELTTELNETRAMEIDMRNKLEEGQKSLGEYQKKQAYYHDKLSKLEYTSLRYTFITPLVPLDRHGLT